MVTTLRCHGFMESLVFNAAERVRLFCLLHMNLLWLSDSFLKLMILKQRTTMIECGCTTRHSVSPLLVSMKIIIYYSDILLICGWQLIKITLLIFVIIKVSSVLLFKMDLMMLSTMIALISTISKSELSYYHHTLVVHATCISSIYMQWPLHSTFVE